MSRGTPEDRLNQLGLRFRDWDQRCTRGESGPAILHDADVIMSELFTLCYEAQTHSSETADTPIKQRVDWLDRALRYEREKLVRTADALRGMVGLVQLVQNRYPDFPVDNHRIIEAMSALNALDVGDSALVEEKDET